MMHIAWPWMALLLPLPWLYYAWRRAIEPQGAAVFLPFLGNIHSPSSASGASNRLARGLYVFAWLLLVAAAMRPQWLGDPVALPTTGRKLLLAVDVSGSMQTQDMAGDATRLQVVQQVAGKFIDGRHGDQVGLILFGTQPYLQTPLTPDLATVHRFLDEAMIGVAGTQTAIGDAIGLALKRLRAADSNDARNSSSDNRSTDNKSTDNESDGSNASSEHANAKQTVLILLTDGQNDAGVMPPLEAARLAAQAGLRIYTIGVGAVAQNGFFGAAGNTDLDEDTLKKIAAATGGQYFRATDADALQAVYHHIDQLEPVAGHDQWLRPADEWFTWPLALALLLSVPATMMGARAWT